MLSSPAVRQRSLSSASSIVLRASATSILRTAGAHAQARSFWGWRRPRDYDSRSDPLYHRFCRYRTLKTRAKLLDKLRRRGRWEWDINQRPFFSPRNIRLASHLPRPKWRPGQEEQQSKDDKDIAEDEGLELSEREKQWKDQMEAMRRRIEQDPYEAIFGKRFEPFWSPLVPSWMREEMGLSRWPKQPSTVSATNPVDSTMPKEPASPPKKTNEQPLRPCIPPRKDQQCKRNKGNELASPDRPATGQPHTARKSQDADPDSPNGQLTNYSYSSSTSWDSVTQKTRREEWDSLSGQTRQYEYDPISNRMVRTTSNELPPPGQETETRSSPAEVKLHKTASASVGSLGSVRAAAQDSSVARAAIPVPTQSASSTSTDRKTSVYFPSLLNTSVVSRAERPAALARVPENDLEVLTADGIRASMGKARHNAVESLPEAPSQARAYRHGKPDPSKSEWDRAETYVLLERELDTLTRKKSKLLGQIWGSASTHRNCPSNVEKQKSELNKLDERIAEVQGQLHGSVPEAMTSRSQPLEPFAEMRRLLMSKYSTQSRLVPATSSLQPSLERMASKELPVIAEPDDSAAHESTGDAHDYKSRNVPRNWERQTDLLQADRVRRTRGTDTQSTRSEQASSDTPAKLRWIDVMNSRRAAYEAQQAQKKVLIEARDAEKNAKLAKANAMLEAEVKEQKSLMQSHENRYAHKIQSLRRELDTAYQQSSTNSEMHVERIRSLERELEKAQKAAGDTSTITRYQSERERFQKKIADLRTELDTAYKQSSVNADMQMERIQKLEAELEKTRQAGSTHSQREKERYMKKVKALREDLDIAFKQSAVQGEKHVERIRELEKELEALRGQSKIEVVVPSPRAKQEFQKTKQHDEARAAQKLRDQALVKEVRQIYENEYGIIDVNHRQVQPQTQPATHSQTQVVEVETDVDLGKALADYEKEQSYQYQKDQLEAEIAAQECEAHEGQAIMTPESAGKGRQVIADKLVVGRGPDSGCKSMTRSRPVGQISSALTDPQHVQWQEPPLYKVLAYDSGNDLLSVATTSSNFTGKETPISIPEALSQLYQPARFVSHFAELQSEGFQVIHGTKDLLLFRKVKEAPKKTTATETQPSLVDHGLVGINPIDGTSRPIDSDTGRFASPTGFVGDNWDTVNGAAEDVHDSSVERNHAIGSETTSPGMKRYCQFMTRNYAVRPKTASSDAEAALHDLPQHVDEAADMERSVSSGRIKREERVFSGGRLKHHREKRRHHHEPSQAQIKEWQKKWKSYRRRMRWALGVGAGASVVAYSIGAAAEKAVEKKDTKEKERWEQILEGKRARWA